MARAYKQKASGAVIVELSEKEATYLFRLIYWHVGGTGKLRVLFADIMDALCDALSLNSPTTRMYTKPLPVEYDRPVVYVMDGE